MHHRMIHACIGCLIVGGLLSPAAALVLHDDAQLAADQHPADAVMGQWGSNASCVAIGPNQVLTTTHQGLSSTVIIDGVAYTATTSSELTGAGCSADIRIAELTLNGEPADLSYWVDLYVGDPTGQEVVLGGYGKGRGAELTTTGGEPYGYQWLNEPNDTLRWGQNEVDMVISGRLLADFDGPTAAGALPYEAAVAEYDSGGGWFVQGDDGRWRLAGLTAAAEHAAEDQSWYADSRNAREDPDRLEALELTYYTFWVKECLDEIAPIAGDADRDGDVDYDDLVALAGAYGCGADAGWSMGNFDGDGDVDLVDLGVLAAGYGWGVPEALDFQADLQAVGLVPEPASLLLLSAGGAVALRRRFRK